MEAAFWASSSSSSEGDHHDDNEQFLKGETLSRVLALGHPKAGRANFTSQSHFLLSKQGCKCLPVAI